MVQLTRLNGEGFYLNADHIEYFENVPDTIIFMQSGRKFVVKETVDELVGKFMDYKRKIYYNMPMRMNSSIAEQGYDPLQSESR